MIFLLVTLIVMYFWFRTFHNRNRGTTVMSLEESRRTQRPYRYGMMLLCVGALINWVGLAENYSEPVRYAGVVCILAGALLICTAMCCWLQTPNRTASISEENDNPIHVITVADETRIYEKPPDYDMVANLPPTYDDAIKLNPALFLTTPTTPAVTGNTEFTSNSVDPNNSIDIDSQTFSLSTNSYSNTLTRPSSSSYQTNCQGFVLPNEIKLTEADKNERPPTYMEANR